MEIQKENPKGLPELLLVRRGLYWGLKGVLGDLWKYISICMLFCNVIERNAQRSRRTHFSPQRIVLGTKRNSERPWEIYSDLDVFSKCFQEALLIS